jgi:hypothetical protein
MLEEARPEGSWASEVGKIPNPFGQGDSGKRIVEIVAEISREVSHGRYRIAG